MATEPRLGDEFELRFGESARIAETGLTVTFAGVAEDSRCPASVVCFWEGDGAVELRMEVPDAGRNATLHTSTQFPRSVEVEGIVLELVELSPYPDTHDPIDRAEYGVVLRANRAP